MRDPRLVAFAKAMRREMTEPETRIWFQLRAKRFDGIKFRRQNVVGDYIADFYSRAAMIIIEIDGDTHAFSQGYDTVREQYFNRLGFQVLRFANNDVMTNLEGVMSTVATVLEARRTSPLPTLSPEGERALAALPPPFRGEGWGEGQ
jgi:very-short-patch-repair endonuclease